MKRFTLVLAILALASIPGPAVGAEERRDSPDDAKRVSGAAHCLQIRTFMPSGGTAKTLAVVLHGDLSRGHDADYIAPVARKAAEHGAVGVAMARPGYTLDGRTSSGEATRDQVSFDRYKAGEIDSIAAAIATLKKHHGANRVVMVGHSGGALISGVMLGRAAPLVDVAILVSCPCDVVSWRKLNHRWPLAFAESPVDYLRAAPKSARIFAVTGENDENTRPVLAQDHVKKARELGLDATYVGIGNAGHSFRRLGPSAGFDTALKQAIGAG